MLQLTNSNEGRVKAPRKVVRSVKRPDKSVTHPAFKLLVAFNIIGAIVAAYLYFNRETVTSQESQVQEEIIAGNDGRTMSRQVRSVSPSPSVSSVKVEETSNRNGSANTGQATMPLSRTVNTLKKETIPAPPQDENNLAEIPAPAGYTVTGPQVYFHNQPDESTRRNAFINRWNKAVLKPLDEKNGFVYVVYTNKWGQTSKGWLLKKQLTSLD